MHTGAILNGHILSKLLIVQYVYKNPNGIVVHERFNLFMHCEREDKEFLMPGYGIKTLHFFENE